MAIPTNDVALLPGKPLVHAATGDRIGDVAEVFVDDATGRAVWLMTRTGMLGTDPRFLPAEGAELVGDEVRVPYSAEAVKSAPEIGEASVRPSPEQEARLREHYGLPTS